jgi:hypothetical protein
MKVSGTRLRIASYVLQISKRDLAIAKADILKEGFTYVYTITGERLIITERAEGKLLDSMNTNIFGAGTKLYWNVAPEIQEIKPTHIAITKYVRFGFRSRVVGGADSINYVRFFTGEQNFYNINDTRDLEPLLMAYNAVLRVLLFNNGTLYLFVTTFIGLFFIYKMVDKYSYNKMLSVLFFFFFLDYSLFFYALRQMLGISVYLGGLLFLLNNEKCRYKWLIYGLCCIGGYFMHTSIFIYGAVITILYFIPIKRKLYLYVAILGSAMLGIVFKQLNFMDFFNMIKRD